MPPPRTRLAVLTQERGKTATIGSRRLVEQNTKRSPIEPVLQALSWDTSSYVEVCLENVTTSAHGPLKVRLGIRGLAIRCEELDHRS